MLSWFASWKPGKADLFRLPIPGLGKGHSTQWLWPVRFREGPGAKYSRRGKAWQGFIPLTTTLISLSFPLPFFPPLSFTPVPGSWWVGRHCPLQGSGEGEGRWGGEGRLSRQAPSLASGPVRCALNALPCSSILGGACLGWEFNPCDCNSRLQGCPQRGPKQACPKAECWVLEERQEWTGNLRQAETPPLSSQPHS